MTVNSLERLTIMKLRSSHACHSAMQSAHLPVQYCTVQYGNCTAKLPEQSSAAKVCTIPKAICCCTTTSSNVSIKLMSVLSCVAVCGPLPANVTTPGTANIWHCEQTPAGTRCTATCANGFVPNPTPPALTCKLTPDGPPEWDLGSFSGACIADPGPSKWPICC